MSLTKKQVEERVRETDGDIIVVHKRSGKDYFITRSPDGEACFDESEVWVNVTSLRDRTKRYDIKLVNLRFKT